MHDDEMSDAGRPVHREQFVVNQKERRVILLRTMIRDFENMIVDLDGQIATEEDRTRVKDPGHPCILDTNEGSEDEAELKVIVEAIEAYEAVRWPVGKQLGGKGLARGCIQAFHGRNT